MTQKRITALLEPDLIREQEAVERAARGFNADILADLIERATGRAFRAGVDAVTTEVLRRAVDEVTKARPRDVP